jgi:cholesterol transport system auxiliary component
LPSLPTVSVRREIGGFQRLESLPPAVLLDTTRCHPSNKEPREPLLITVKPLMRTSKPILALGLMTAIASLIGCAGKIRYPNYYVLNLPVPVPAANRPAAVLGSVAVREFDAPSFLRGGPIAYRESAEQLDYYQYHRWAADPRQAVTGAVIQQLQARGVFQNVDRFDGRGNPEYLLTGAIDHLEEVDQDSNVSIEVSLSARLINLRTGEVVWHGASSKTAKLDQRSVPGVVAEMSREMVSAVEGLVSAMRDQAVEASLSQQEN